MARVRAFKICALAAAPAHGIWPFGRRTTALAKKVRSLERDTLEFESNERILLEQLRQMRLTTGELRTTLRESIAESERVAAENAAAVAKLEGEVATLKTTLVAAEQRAAAAEASAAKAVDMESSLAAARKAKELMLVAGDTHVFPITTLDGAKIGDGRVGPVAAALLRALERDAEGD